MEQRFLLFNEGVPQEEAWTDLSQFEWRQRRGSEWSDLDGNVRVWNGNQWESISDAKGLPEVDNTLSFGVNSYNKLAGVTGTPPFSSSVGQMVSSQSDPLFSGMRPLLLRGDSGYYKWTLGNSRTAYIRAYVRPTPAVGNDYSRRFISFYQGDTEVCSLTLFMHQNDAKGVIAYVEDGALQYINGDELVFSGWGSFQPNQWTRVEVMIERPQRVHFRIYTDPHSTVPSSDVFFELEKNIRPFDRVEINEYGGLFGMYRGDIAVQSFGLSSHGWVGPASPAISQDGSTGVSSVTTNSTSAPLPISNISADRYVICTVVYADSHTNNTVPSITPPSGFTRLGFEYLGNSGGNIRSVMGVYGRYFNQSDSSNKSMFVGGGRSGQWLVQQRVYTNVHPEYPVASAWVGTSNSASDSKCRLLLPEHIEETVRGDMVAYSAMVKNSVDNTSLPGSAIQNALSNPGMQLQGSGRNINSVAPGRRVTLVSDNHVLLDATPHPVNGFCIDKIDQMISAEAYGRVVLRRNRVLDEVPDIIPEYPLPSTIPNLPAPPDPEPEPPEYETRTTTWNDTWNCSFYNFGKRSGSNIYQGRVGSSTGNEHSYVGFNYSSITSTLSGATIERVEVYLNNSHWYYGSGGTARIGTHNLTSEPSGSPSGHKYHRSSVNFNVGQAKWVTVPNSIGNDFRSGAARGITLGRPTSGSLADYGYFAGNSTRLRITYTRRIN